jgi:ABC-type polysaccharide/polyol phosphate transport system ATPase subunit
MRERRGAALPSPAALGGAVATFRRVTAIASGKHSAAREANRPGPAPAVSVQHVSKSFRLPHERYHTLKQRALHPFRSRRYDLLHAVEDVSVEIPMGEFFGIVGRNGSGKSTLLKCLAGIYQIDSGEVEISGRLSPFIELGVGFNPELTARDNVIINAIMLGLTRTEALERFDAIVAFAELEDFMEVKLKNYSSGMQVRLAFAVAIQVDAEILLIDEVLAVGDAAFQQKCFEEFGRLKAAGRTIVFVTHDMSTVERFCDRAMLMDHGRVVDIGDAIRIARRYNEVNFRRIRSEVAEGDGPESMKGEPVAEVRDARFEHDDGTTQHETFQGQPLTVLLEVHFHADTVDPIFIVGLQNERGTTVFASSSKASYGSTGSFDAGTTALIRVRFENWLAPGRYQLMTSIGRDGSSVEPYDVREQINSIFVHASVSGGGVVDLPHAFTIERA